MSLATIRQEIEALGLQATWTMEAEARDYRGTLAIEASMEADPVVKSQWITHQLEVDQHDVISFDEFEEEPEEAATTTV